MLAPEQTRALRDIAPGAVALLGIPFDEFSSFLRGPAKAPAIIRRTLHSGASNLTAENGIDLAAHPRLLDLGDLRLPGGEAAMAAITDATADLTASGVRLLALGGDHAVTYPVVRALTAIHARLTIVHLDAHPDLYDHFKGNRFSHACPFARIMETGKVDRLIQIGIRGLNAELRRQVARFGVTCIEMARIEDADDISPQGPVYLSVDLDVLDPAFAPGVSHHEPGGMATRQVIRLIQSIHAPIVGADIVEFNPDRDLNGMTAAVAAKLTREIAGQMLAQEV